MLPHLHLLLIVSIGRRLRRLGGVGLVVLGVADNSVIPLTGSMDILTIYLAARHRETWPYYALMATLGAVIGGYITYALARKGGKQAMERKLSKRRAAKVYATFERWGFWAVAIPALLPPPFPFVPDRRRRFAVLAEKIPRRFDAGPLGSLLDRCGPGSALWNSDRSLFLSLLQTGSDRSHWSCRFGRRGDL